KKHTIAIHWLSQLRTHLTDGISDSKTGTILRASSLLPQWLTEKMYARSRRAVAHSGSLAVASSVSVRLLLRSVSTAAECIHRRCDQDRKKEGEFSSHT